MIYNFKNIYVSISDKMLKKSDKKIMSILTFLACLPFIILWWLDCILSYPINKIKIYHKKNKKFLVLLLLLPVTIIYMTYGLPSFLIKFYVYIENFKELN